MFLLCTNIERPLNHRVNGVEQLIIALMVLNNCHHRQMGSSLVSCVFADDPKEYLITGTAYVREEVM